MKRSTVVLFAALTLFCAVPVSVAVSEDCRKAAFDLVWKAKVRAMQAWDNDPKHRAYVERHKLKTADRSPATAALKARMLKGIDLACGVESIARPTASAAGGEEQLSRLVAAEDLFAAAVPREQDVVPAELRGVIAKDELPVYDSPERVYDGGVQAPGGWYGGWFAAPVGGQLASITPVVPIAATPEPAGAWLALTGVVCLGFLLRWKL
jgi:hypothetical protein